MKRVIRDIPVEIHLGNGAVIYDGVEDMIVPDDFDHTGALYVAIDEPVYEDVDGKQVKKADVTELIKPHSKLKKRHTFAGWPAVGADVPPPEPVV